jgi:hypothetical protein
MFSNIEKLVNSTEKSRNHFKVVQERVAARRKAMAESAKA